MISRARNGLTLVELLVVIAIVGMLIAITIPAAQQARERARATQCQNNLRQIGLALHAYHATCELFPPGCVGVTGDPINIQGWGWAMFILPYVEQGNLYATISPNQNSMQTVLASADLQPLVRTPLAVFRCASDTGDDLQTSDRTLSGFVLGTLDPLTSTYAIRSPMTILAQEKLLACLIVIPPIPGGSGTGNGHTATVPTGTTDDPTSVPAVDPTIYGVRAATSNYVASFGDLWRTDSAQWAPQDFAGNGGFGSNVSTRLSDMTDGSSHTFAIGERSSQSYAAIWAGTDGWDRCEREGITNVMGTAFYAVNSDPEPYYLSCDSKGAGGFGSMHVGGANFLMLDGSVRFVSNQIDFANSSDPSQLGLYQRLARRNDGEPTGDP